MLTRTAALRAGPAPPSAESPGSHTVHRSSPHMKKPLRIALWVLAGLATAFALIVVLGLGSLSRTGYAFPDRDLPPHLAGRWDWSTRAQPCRDGGHVISFSADRKTMTIKQPSLGAYKGWSATYDILHLGPTRLRGAIRGETRLTDAGTPVVWDLVMIGPDEYRWQRTDWPSWQFTAGVQRCSPDQAGEAAPVEPLAAAGS